MLLAAVGKEQWSDQSFPLSFMHKALRKAIGIKRSTWSEGVLMGKLKETGNVENNMTDSQFILN